MRSGDKVKLSVVRLLIAAIQNAEIARQAQLTEDYILGIIAKEGKHSQESIKSFKQGKRGEPVAQLEAEFTARQAELTDTELAEIARQAKLTDNDILGIIAKEARQRQESIESFKQGNRPDLVAQEEAELAILQVYLPKQMSRDEIIVEARRVIVEVSAQGPSDKGKVMPKLMAQLKGRADGREINAVVTELLKSL